MSLQKRFYLLIALILIIKVFFAFSVPITGDEAYFVFWAQYPDYGYYDHPPMVAWILTLLLSFSDAVLWLRLPAIVFSLLTTWIIYKVLYKNDDLILQKTAIYAASIYMLIPLNLVAVLMTTDTPLVLFSFLSGISYYQSQKQDSFTWYFICGLFLGLAFLSKFFSILLALAFLLHTIIYVRRGRRPYIGLLIIFTVFLPSVILNLIWNYNNCWNNYLFNLINRTNGNSFSFKGAGKYLLTLVFIMPPAIYYGLKNKESVKALLLSRNADNTFIALFIIPILFFAVLSLFKTIGGHWLFSFIPFLVLGIANVFDLSQLKQSLKFMAVFSIIIIIIIGFMIATLPTIFQSNDKLYKSLVIGYYPNEILHEVSKYKADFVFATDSYALSAQLGYQSREHLIVFGAGSYHARQDDFITDFRSLKEKDILILSEVNNLAMFSDYFNDYEIHTIKIQGTELYYALGRKFQYEWYKDSMLIDIREQYYNIPDYLPKSGCYMEERYGND